MIISIHQPNYIPWSGYFHKMLSSDLFVILDDVDLSRRAITNKNKIKSPDGPRLLSVPLANKSGKIKDVTTFDDDNWPQKHWGSIQRSYARAPFWKQYQHLFWPIYENPNKKLADLNLQLIEIIRTVLEIKTPIIRSSEIEVITGHKGEKIINICKALNATVYLSGTGAKTYNDEKEFEKNQIRLVYQEFEPPVYPQLWGEFIPNLSVIDLLFNCGPKSKEFIPKQVIYE
ncbi:WbqC family protein [Neobacillus cucumis]|uniref:WbqC family protein n=1 Tax=Neobacillus cucumis TaxID=1740721 RepID=UPI002853427D|nr:WbqC family protein [Neobacillus cucumis]MDR4947833.1 WbqC family protein [Neobacillus cucumis]